jgi:hypothetical protein
MLTARTWQLNTAGRIANPVFLSFLVLMTVAVVAVGAAAYWIASVAL